MKEGKGFETRAIHEGEDPEESQGAIIPPIYMSSTYEHHGLGERGRYDYSRTGNPTREILERKVAALEGGGHGLAFASGMAAVNAVLVLLSSGDGVVSESNVYGGTHRLLTRLYSRFGISPAWVDATDLDEVEGALREKEPALLWIETPTNPLLKIVDIGECARLAHDTGALLVVDNTFASPYLQRPLELGADVVVHSTTKFIGGHSDFVGGLVVTDREDLWEKMAYLQNAVGAVPSPFDCWLAVRSLKTLSVRMREHCSNARRVARFLDRDPRVRKVYYPGLEGHPGHGLAREQMDDFGSMISFELDADPEETARFISGLGLFRLAVSLGAVESLVAHPVTMTHTSLSKKEMEESGLSESLIRISVGLEHPGDLLTDIENALLQAFGTSGVGG